jgi:hypothetical protein
VAAVAPMDAIVIVGLITGLTMEMIGAEQKPKEGMGSTSTKDKVSGVRVWFSGELPVGLLSGTAEWGFGTRSLRPHAWLKGGVLSGT